MANTQATFNEDELIELLSGLAPLDYDRIMRQVSDRRTKWSVSGLWTKPKKK